MAAAHAVNWFFNGRIAPKDPILTVSRNSFFTPSTDFAASGSAWDTYSEATTGIRAVGFRQPICEAPTVPANTEIIQLMTQLNVVPKQMDTLRDPLAKIRHSSG